MTDLSATFYDRLVKLCHFCEHPREWHTSWHGCSKCGCTKTAKDASALGIKEEKITLREAIEGDEKNVGH